MVLSWSAQTSPIQALTLQGLPANQQAFGIALPGGAYVINGNFDPAAAGVTAPTASIFMRSDNGAVYAIDANGTWNQL